MLVAYAGHRLDAPGRVPPRFPVAQIDAVAAAVERALARIAPDGVVGAAAAGADLLVLDAARRLRIPTRIVLPLRTAEFRARSVGDRGVRWAVAFDRALMDAASVSSTDLSRFEDWYLRGNDLILDYVRTAAPPDRPTGPPDRNNAGPVALVVRVPAAARPSATDDFTAKAVAQGLTVVEIDPQNPDESTSVPPGPTNR